MSGVAPGRPGHAWRRWTPLRRGAQLAFAALYLGLPLLNAAGGRELLGTLGSLRVGPVDLTEPAAALSAALAGGAAAPVGALLAGAALPVLLALALGPVFCSWVCPFGLLSELLDRALPWRRRWDARAHERARGPRLVALALLLGGSAAVGAPLAAVVQGPRAITVAAQEALYLGAVSAFAGGLLGALLLLDLALPRRLFCRALCPAGALLDFVRTRRTLRVRWNPARCGCPSAPACQTRCAWGVDPRTAGRFDGCTSCLACLDACPSGALTATFAPMAGSPPAGAHHGREAGDTMRVLEPSSQRREPR